MKLIALFFSLAIGASSLWAQVDSTVPTQGLHQARPEWLMIDGATVHVAADKILENAAVLIQGNRIVEVGTTIKPPAGTRIISGKGKHVYPSFIDPYVPVALEKSELASTSYWNGNIRPDRSAAVTGSLNLVKVNDWRKAGFGAAVLAPNSGIVQGKSALFLLGDGDPKQTLLRADVAMNLSLTRSVQPFGEERGAGGGPTSPMGAYALGRQAMHDAIWYRDAWKLAQANPKLKRPEVNASLTHLLPVIEGSMPVVIKASNEIFALRAKRFATEFGLRWILLGSGMEYRRLQEIADLSVPVILPLNFPDPPELNTPMDALVVSLEDLMHWDHAPENPARLAKSNVQLAFTANGLDNPGEFLGKVRLAVRRGLAEADALQALTINAARLMGVEDQMGTLEKGKISNFIVTDGPLFDDKSKIISSCVGGQYFEYDRLPAREFDGLWAVETEGDTKDFFLTIATKPKLAVSIFTEDPTSSDKKPLDVKNPKVVNTQVSGGVDAAVIGQEGKALFSISVDVPEQGMGMLFLPDGQRISLIVKRLGDAPKKKESKEDNAPKEEGKSEKPPQETETDEDTSAEDDEWDRVFAAAQDLSAHNHTHGGPLFAANWQEEKDPVAKGGDSKEKKLPLEPSSYPVNYPFGDYGRVAIPEPVQQLLIRNVTVWTSGPQGKLENGAVLIENGLIKQVFSAGQALPEVPSFDGKGMHLTPGLIDCHSHMATDSGVNEVGQAITAEVRIGDFIDCDDITIHRQLSGGLTTSNILHGSANPIGGQNQVIKLRWGQNDDGMKFKEAPQGIKFALGENVKQSNRRSPEPATRYPQTRMGVEQLMHDTFRAAREYEAAHKNWKANRTGLPPRVDLELEAIVEILNHSRWIHCHSYRQDEILALIRVLDQYGITIGSFQHILEGYKVADAIAKHGGTASAFSDWWAYKYEVIDGIPQAGALMHEAGIVVSFNSDDSELARHMNHEAAKAVRYGNVSEEEALKFVTLNPAKQLRIDQYVGSIEAGKHADFVLWSGHPLALSSRCEQTWIDGRKYYDRAEAEKIAQEQSQQRAVLIQKALKVDPGKKPSIAEQIDESLLWPRYDEYCHGHSHDHVHEDR
ncbi:MAG: amidohydrolase family protein [Pirellulaceae bacterium]